MNKFLSIIIAISVFCLLPVYAVDYAYNATIAFNECISNRTKCTEAKKFITDGIKYYGERKNSSYSDLKNYCGLIYLRVSANSWGDTNQWQRDVYELNSVCKF